MTILHTTQLNKKVRKASLCKEKPGGLERHGMIARLRDIASLTGATTQTQIAQWVVIAGLIHSPEAAASFLNRISPDDFSGLQRIIARCARSGVAMYGMADISVIRRLALHYHYRADVFDLMINTANTLAWSFDVGSMLPWAVDVLRKARAVRRAA